MYPVHGICLGRSICPGPRQGTGGAKVLPLVLTWGRWEEGSPVLEPEWGTPSNPFLPGQGQFQDWDTPLHGKDLGPENKVHPVNWQTKRKHYFSIVIVIWLFSYSNNSKCCQINNTVQNLKCLPTGWKIWNKQWGLGLISISKTSRPIA